MRFRFVVVGPAQIYDFEAHAVGLRSTWLINCIELKQECIPVGCVPPALYRTGGVLPDKDPPPTGQRPPPPPDRQTSVKTGGNNFTRESVFQLNVLYTHTLRPF